MKGKTTLLALSLLALSALADNRTMFVHHKSEVDVFLFAEIDSICYSPIDTDSVYYGVPIVQEIWTADSVYRYNLEEIDSVTFQSPATIAKPGAIDLNKGLDLYIFGQEEDKDGPILVMYPDTPTELRPSEGDLLYQLQSTEELPGGFLGRVAYVDDYGAIWGENIYVYCERVQIDEVFDQLAWQTDVIIATADEEEEVELETLPRRTAANETVGTIPWLVARPKYPDLLQGVLTMTDELNDIPAGPEHPQIVGQIGIQPAIACSSGAYVINLPDGKKQQQQRMHSKVDANVEAMAYGRYIVEGEHSVGGDRAVKKTFGIGLGQTCNLTYTGNMRLKGTMGLDYKYSNGYSTVVDSKVTYNEYGEAEVSSSVKHCQTKPLIQSLDASFSGELTLTGTLSLTQVFSGSELKSLTNSISYGSKLKGNSLFLNSQIDDAKEDNALYERITAAGVDATAVENVLVSASYDKAKLKAKTKLPAPVATKFYPVPKIDELSYTNSTFIYKLSGEPMNFAHSDLGIAVKKNGSFEWISANKTWPNNCKEEFQAQYFYDQSSKEVVYPTVTLPSGDRILAAPAYPKGSYGIFPIVSMIQANGTTFTIGSPMIGSASGNGIVVVAGNVFPHPQ